MVSARHRASRRGRGGAQRDPPRGPDLPSRRARACPLPRSGPAGWRACARCSAAGGGVAAGRARDASRRLGRPPAPPALHRSGGRAGRAWSTSAAAGVVERGASGSARRAAGAVLTLGSRCRAARTAASAQVISLGPGARLLVSAEKRAAALRTMAAPIAFVYGNCVFAHGLDDAWAAFARGRLLLRVAERGSQARSVPRADRRARGDRGGRADPARLRQLAARALRASRARGERDMVGLRAALHASALRALHRRARQAARRHRRRRSRRCS